jgi:hypothetical protein
VGINLCPKDLTKGSLQPAPGAYNLTKFALAPYSISGKSYKTATSHPMFLGWQAVSLGRDYNSMRTQDKVLLVGLLEKETWATVLAVATAYTATVSTKDTSRRLSLMKCLS